MDPIELRRLAQQIGATDLARGLTGWGILGPTSPLVSAEGEARSAMIDAASVELTRAPETPLVWSPPSNLDGIVLPSAADPPLTRFAAAWRDMSAVSSMGLRVEISPEIAVREPNLEAIIAQLVNPTTRVESAYIRLDPPPVGPLLGLRRWPLRVGFLNDPASRRFQRLIWRAAPSASTVHITSVRPGDQVDILLLPAALAHGDVLEQLTGVRATLVLLLGDRHGPLRAASTLQQLTSARGLAFAAIGEERIPIWLRSLVRVLRDGASLDTGLTYAAQAVHALPPLLLADRALAGARPGGSSRAESIALGFGVSAEPEYAETIVFGADPPGATPAPGPTDDHPQARLLQARVFDVDSNLVRRAFAAEARHFVEVRVGPPDLAWAASGEPFPDEQLPRSTSPLPLIVRFVHLNAAQTIGQEHGIDLPPRHGPSTTAVFTLQPEPGSSHVEAMISVWYRAAPDNIRLLQQAHLIGRVADSPRAVPDDWPPIRLATAIQARTLLSALDASPGFGGAIHISGSADGGPAFWIGTQAGDHYAVHVSGLGSELRVLQDVLEHIVEEPGAYSSLFDAATATLLRQLAHHGRLLFAAIDGAPELKRQERLQFTTAWSNLTFPIELVYDRADPVPGAPLCPNALAGLQSGYCQSACPDEADEATVVCPLGFWGLRKVIESHSSSGVPTPSVSAACARPEPLPERDWLGPLHGIVSAASAKVNGFQDNPNQIADLRAALKKAAGGVAEHAETWAEWRANIRNMRPSLLVLLPHTLISETVPALEIGDREHLLSSGVDCEYVAVSDAARPLVLLLGCATASIDRPFAEFPTAFHLAGAPIVVATLSRILGRHAAPVAIQLVEELFVEAAGLPRTFGEVMLTVRRKLLSAGMPMVMALTAYGDANWKFGLPDA